MTHTPEDVAVFVAWLRDAAANHAHSVHLRAALVAGADALAERDDRDERIDDLTARLAQANMHLAELGFVPADAPADAPAERAEPPDSLPPLAGIAAFVQRVLRSVRGSREDYACRHCGQMMSAHDMSTLGSVFCPGEVCGQPSPVTPEPPGPMPEKPTVTECAAHGVLACEVCMLDEAHRAIFSGLLGRRQP